MIDKQKLIAYLQWQMNHYNSLAEKDDNREPHLMARQSIYIGKALEHEVLLIKLDKGDFDFAPLPHPTCSRTCLIHGQIDHGACDTGRPNYYCVCLLCERLSANQ